MQETLEKITLRKKQEGSQRTQGEASNVDVRGGGEAGWMGESLSAAAQSEKTANSVRGPWSQSWS